MGHSGSVAFSFSPLRSLRLAKNFAQKRERPSMWGNQGGGGRASKKGSAFQILAVDQSGGCDKVPQDLSLTIAQLSALWTNQTITAVRHTRSFIGPSRLETPGIRQPVPFSGGFLDVLLHWTLATRTSRAKRLPNPPERPTTGPHLAIPSGFPPRPRATQVEKRTHGQSHQRLSSH